MKDPGHGYLAILVVNTQKGDKAAFSELYSLTYNKIYNYAYHYLRDAYLAQDAVQEVYILAYKKIHTIKDPLLFAAWLNQIAFRVCYDMCKKNDADYGVIDDEFLNSFQDESLSRNPEKKIEKQEQQLRLREAIEKLPHLQRSVIIMKFFNNMKLSDISDAMDISLSSVKRQMEQAKNTLRDAMNA